MEKIKIEITYNGHSFKFNDGLKAYIFHLGIKYGMLEEIGYDGIMKYVKKTYDVATYPNTTWVEDVSEFIAENWDKLKDFGAERIFDRFAADCPDGSEDEDDEEYFDEDEDEE